MAAIFKKQYTKPIPAGAKIVTRMGKRVAQWKVGNKLHSAELTAKGDKIRAQASVYTAKYRDGDGIVREVSTGCRDKSAAMAVLNDLTTMADRVRAKVITSAEVRIATEYADTLLSEHIDDYVAYLKQRKANAGRVKTTDTRLKGSATECSWRYLRDLSSDGLESWLNKQVDAGRSAAVYNGYAEVWIAFGFWCIGKRMTGKQSHYNGNKRMLNNPFDGMRRLDAKADRRRKARAMTSEELARLLDAAQRRPLNDAMTVRTGSNKGLRIAKVSAARRAELERLGFERSLIYKTAILTGLRLNELQTLTVNCLSFGDVPFVRLDRSNEKNRKGSTLALRSDLAVDLRGWVAGKALTDTVFNVPDGLLRIMDRDLVAAGIPKRDEDDYVVHIHALRHSFGTHLSMAGVAPRVAQAAMRHSDIKLTMNTYTDARLLDTASAVESLPNLPLAPHAPPHAPDADYCGQILSIPDHSSDSTKGSGKRKYPAKCKRNAGFSLVGVTGFEPAASASRTQRATRLRHTPKD